MVRLLKRINDAWYINENILFKQIKNYGISKDDRENIEKYIIKYAVNNIAFLNFFINKMKEVGNYECGISYQLSPGQTLCFVNIDDNIIINSLTATNFILSKYYINKIKYYKSSEYFNKNILYKKVFKNITYSKLIDLMNCEYNEFKNLINKDNFWGISGKKLLDIIENDKVFNEIEFNDEKYSNFYKNYCELKYYYEEDLVDNRSFPPTNSLVGQFEITKELEESVMNEIPDDYNLLHKAYYIYKRLCQKFTYDSEYFYLKEHKKNLQGKINHKDIERLSTIKGGEKMICIGISLLFAKFLDKLNIPFMLLDYNDNIVTDTNAPHIKVRFKYGNYIIDADPAHGLYKSDMVYEKTFGRSLNFNCINTAKRVKDTFDSEKEFVDKYFDEVITEFNDARQIYKDLYENNSNSLEFNEKIELLKDIIKSQSIEYFDMIDLLSRVKKSLFIDNGIEKVGIEFFVNKNNNDINLEILLVYNANQSINQDLFKNTYLIFNSKKGIELTDYSTLKEKFGNGLYDFTNDRRNFLNLKGGSNLYGDEENSRGNRLQGQIDKRR